MNDIADAIGGIPYRLALCGGWIDQPFVSALDPSPPGSMTVVAVEPDYRFMDMAGMATSTRKVAARLWGPRLPDRPPAELVRELYAEENRGRPEPSGAQDMVGLCYPGITRMDFDARFEGGVFPKAVESCEDEAAIAWIEGIIKIVPVAPRPEGYSPLGERHLDVSWVRRLGASGRDCYDAITRRDLKSLQGAMRECMLAWEALLPQTIRHPLLRVDLVALLEYYRNRYGGAMYSGCGGGYLFVATEESVPGSFGFRVRRTQGDVARRSGAST
jgi:hypothetical protein